MRFLWGTPVCLVSVLIAWRYPLVGIAMAVLGCCLAVGIWFRRDGVFAANRRASTAYAVASLALLGFASRDSIRQLVRESHQLPLRANRKGVQQTLVVTAYCNAGLTAAGTWAGWGTAASNLELGTQLYVPGYGKATVLDRGSAVGPGKLDLYMPNCAEAEEWGRRSLSVSILGVEAFGHANVRLDRR
jgi:3D (Asp-Asp-Asp) domain-containing protein